MKLTFRKQITQLEHAEFECEMMSLADYASQIRPMLDQLDKRMAVLNREVIKANIAQGQLSEKEGAAVLNVLYGLQGLRTPAPSADDARPVVTAVDEAAV